MTRKDLQRQIQETVDAFARLPDALVPDEMPSGTVPALKKVWLQALARKRAAAARQRDQGAAVAEIARLASRSPRQRAMEEALHWPAGAALDAYVAQTLEELGYESDASRRGRWSSDARAIVRLLEDMTSPYMRPSPWVITLGCEESTWSCTITGDHWVSEGCGPTLALAVCRALILEEDVDERP